MPARALDKDSLIFIANSCQEPCPTDGILRCRDWRTCVIIQPVQGQTGIWTWSVSCQSTRLFHWTTWPKHWLCLFHRPLGWEASFSPLWTFHVPEGEGSAWKRNVHASVKIGVIASCLPFIFTNVHFFLSLFFFILPRDDDWQVNICLTACLRNQKEGAVRIACQKMRLGALVICWGLQLVSTLKICH